MTRQPTTPLSDKQKQRFRAPWKMAAGLICVLTATAGAGEVPVGPPANVAPFFNNARDVKIVDWDQDGRQDIVAAAFDAGEVKLWRQRDFGWLESTWPLGGGPANDLEIGDIDSNGQPDLVYVFGNGAGTNNKIGVVLNRSSDLLVTVETTGLGNPQCVTLGDLDDDGDLDVISCEFGGNEVNWHENLNGDGVTWVTHSTAFGLGNPADAIVHDVDVDGDLDIVVAGFSRITWLENRLDETVATWLAHDVDTNVTAADSVVMGDVDGDGQNEIVAGCINSALLAWWDRPTVLTNPWTRNEIQSTTAITDVGLSDLDQDGDLDILASKWGAANGGLVYWEGDGFGHFQSHELGGVYQQLRATAVGDLDGDGDADFALAAGNSDVVETIENLTIRSKITTAVVDPTKTEGSGPTPLVLATVDLDRDGDPDIVSYDDDERLRWRDSAFDTGIVLQATSATLNSDRAFALADVDNDGDNDVVMGLDDGLEWLRNNGFGNQYSRHTIDTADGIENIEVIDLNLDGQLDVVGFNGATNELRWWRNTGGGAGWFENQIDGSLTTFQDMSSGDVDGDGDPEIIVAADGEVTAYHRIADIAFSHSTVSTIDVTLVLARDLDSDGDIDVYGYSPNGPTGFGLNYYWENDGNGGGWDEWDEISIQNAHLIKEVDLDLDGDLDLVTSSPTGSKIAFNPDSTLHPFPAGGWNLDGVVGTTTLDIADFSGDGFPDLVAVQHDGALIEVDVYPGQFRVGVVSGPLLTVVEGTSEDIGQIEVMHLGRLGDQDLDMTQFRLQITTGGIPLTNVQMDGVFQRISLIRDDIVTGTLAEIIDPAENGDVTFPIGSAGGLERITSPVFVGIGPTADIALQVELEADAADVLGVVEIRFTDAFGEVLAEDALGTPLTRMPWDGWIINVAIEDSGEPPLFADGFESASTSAWDLVVP